MAAVVNHSQQPLPSKNTTSAARHSPALVQDLTRNASPAESASPTMTTPAAGPAPGSAAAPRGKAKAKKGGNTASDPADAHKALLSKISQLEATSTEDANANAEIEAEVKKANRDLTQLLNTLEPHNSRLEALQRKYSELLHDMKKVEREQTKAKKRGDQLQKEKEEITKERTKERGLKEKLEKLSRELTRDNKRLKEDYHILKENAADRNEELHLKLENMILDVEEVIADRRPPDLLAADMEQDRLFREKFTSFLHQYELRELHFQSLLRTKDLEIAYQTARHDQLKKTQEIESSKSHQLTRQVSTFSQTENELRGQLNVYVEKFKQVEDTLNNSNDLFLTFRKEMEEMSKKTKRLEKENLSLTRKQEATNKNIFQMAEERSQSQQTIDRLQRENEKLKKLCRAMQTSGYNAPGMAGHPNQHALASQHHTVAGADQDYEGTESEYDDEEYDEEDDEEDDGEYDDDTEEELSPALGMDEHGKPVYGPVPPPPQPPASDGTVRNGTGAKITHGQANGNVTQPNGTGVPRVH